MDAARGDDPPAAGAEVVTPDLRKLAEAATPGPWSADAWKKILVDGVSADVGSIDAALVLMDGAPQLTADAAYIAAANPTTILSLLDRLEKAEAEARGGRDAALEEAAAVCDADAHEYGNREVAAQIQPDKGMYGMAMSEARYLASHIRALKQPKDQP